MKLAVAAAALVAVSSTAHGQPGNVDPQPYPAPVEPVPEPQPQPQYVVAPQPVVRQTGNQVDPDVAMGLSLGGTVLSWGMLIAASRENSQSEGLATAGAIGTLFAPSFGHWYAHHGFSRGLGLRLAGLAAATIGFSMALDDFFDENDDGDEGAAAGLMLVGAGLYIGGTIDDIATAGSAARKYNSRFENVGIVPTANAHGGGVSVVGRF